MERDLTEEYLVASRVRVAWRRAVGNVVDEVKDLLTCANITACAPATLGIRLRSEHPADLGDGRDTPITSAVG